MSIEVVLRPDGLVQVLRYTPRLEDAGRRGVAGSAAASSGVQASVKASSLAFMKVPSFLFRVARLHPCNGHTTGRVLEPHSRAISARKTGSGSAPDTLVYRCVADQVPT